MTDSTVVLDHIRDWLAQGATISATDPEGRVLLPEKDGTWHGGLDVRFPHDPDLFDTDE